MASQPTHREIDAPRCVTPYGSIVRGEWSSLWIGDRGGSLHRGDGSLRAQRWISERWVYHQTQKQSTEHGVATAPLSHDNTNVSLSFLDEVTALAAGHRPCDIQQTVEAKRFLKCWSASHGAQTESWDTIDQTLHAERLNAHARKQLHKASLRDLPDGSMFSAPAGDFLLLGGRCFLWSTRGYAAAVANGAHDVVDVLTPASVVGALRAGYEPDIHESILKLM
ncbi:MAG: hypothetical protein AAGD43_16160 [Pseudomonadota bacterium]